MDFGSILSPFVQNPQIQTAAIGVAISVGINQFKNLAKTVDGTSEKKYKVPVQLMITVCTGLAAIGDLYLKSQLNTYDPHLIVNFLTIALPAYLAAMGSHKVGTMLKGQDVSK
jgi:hypothetical protein